MPSILSAARRPGATAVGVGLLAVAATLSAVLAPASARPTASAAHVTSVSLHRGGPDATIGFNRGRTGEAFLDVTVSAPGVSWADAGNESAVVSAYVDGHYATDIVITSSAPVDREFALGHLRAGRHSLRLHYAAPRSPSDAGVARLKGIAVRTVDSTSPAYVAAKYAPVLDGRNVATLGNRFQNNHTDTPLVAWHEVHPAATPGHSVIEYSVVWSNEDGGTNTPSLMSVWGRTTDIEWIYRVEVDAKGRRVGSGVFQSPNHGTEAFHGPYDGTHPVLQTCTSNNNVCDGKALKPLKQGRDPMRFALSTRDVLPADQPREHEMDIHPWTYQVMAREMLREHKVGPSPAQIRDQRDYVYLSVTRTTDPAASAGGVGIVVDVRLNGDPTTYTSNDDNAFGVGSVNRDGPAATTVELPVGTTSADIESISVRRVPFLTENGASVTVTDLGRAFFLGTDYLPRPSFAQWHGSLTLTAASPTAQVWPPTP